MSDAQRAEWSSYVDGPKWAGLRMVLHDAAMLHRVSLDIYKEDRAILRHTLYFRAAGAENNVVAFRAAALAAVDAMA